MARKKTARDTAVVEETIRDTRFTTAHDVLRKPTLIPTAFEAFNTEVLRVGGFPLGRFVQVFGPEHSGKTSMCLHVAAMAQRLFPDKNVAWLDTEYKLDRDWAETQGVDLKRMFIHSTGIAEEAFGWTNDVVRNGNISVLIVDSLGNIAPNMAYGDAQWTLDSKGDRVHKPRPGHTAALETE